MNSKEIIKDIIEALKGKEVISSFTFFPRILFKGIRVLSCSKHSIECLMQSGCVDQRITLSFELMSDEFLNFIRNKLNEQL